MNLMNDHLPKLFTCRNQVAWYRRGGNKQDPCLKHGRMKTLYYMNPNYMIPRVQLCLYGTIHLSLILQNILCIIFYRSINFKVPLHRLDAQDHGDFRIIGVVCILLMEQMSYMPWRSLGIPKVFLEIFGGKCANLLPPLYNA